MDLSELKLYVEDNYSICIESIEKVKNTYKVISSDGEYGLKIIKYDFPHFYFIISAIDHLQKKGFNRTPEIIESRNKTKYMKLGNKFAYLTKWIPSRVSNYSNPVELCEVSKKLGELHSCSYGFNLKKSMKPRIGWYSWINVFNTRCDEILDFNKRIEQKAYKSEFDCIFKSNVEAEIIRGKKAIDGLINNNYYGAMDNEVMKRGFCHHDYAHHNVLIDNENCINIIDFDYCILDSHIHDLCSLLIRVMKDGKWNDETADLILENYSVANSISDLSLKLMKYFIMFPQGFWQVGLQYYWEQQPWEEEFFLNRLNKYLDDREERQEFIEKYFK